MRTTLSCLVLSMLVDGAAARAQMAASTLDDAPQRVWGSLGLGAGTGSTFAGVVAGWYSRGRVAVGMQYSSVQPLWSTDVHESTAVMVGARTSGDRFFLVGGIGPATARFLTDCMSACTYHSVQTRPALGFSGQAVANAAVLGFTLSTFGALGERRVSYAGVALSLAIGWFGI